MSSAPPPPPPDERDGLDESNEPTPLGPGSTGPLDHGGHGDRDRGGDAGGDGADGDHGGGGDGGGGEESRGDRGGDGDRDIDQPPRRKTVPVNYAVPLNGAVPPNGAVPLRGRAPLDDTVPLNDTVPPNDTVPLNDTFLLSDTVPLDDTVPLRDTVPPNDTVPFADRSAADGTRNGAASDPVKRSRSWLAAIIAAGVVLALLVALVIADAVVRTSVRDAIARELETALPIERGSEVDVKVGGFSILAQLAAGTLERIEVNVESVTFGEISGAAEVVATGVPIDRTRAAGSVAIDFFLDEEQLQDLTDNLSGIPLDSVTIEDDEVRIGTELSVFSIPIPIGIGIEPGAEAGELTFTPSGIVLGAATVSADDLRRTFGPLADQVLETRSVCIAEFLPSAFVLEGADVERDEIVVRLGADNVVLSEEELETMGTCPAS